MNPRRIDMTGRRYGRLVVLRFWKSVKSKPVWLCKCDCGVEKYVLGNALRQGETKSCGCLRTENAAIARTFITTTKKKAI